MHTRLMRRWRRFAAAASVVVLLTLAAAGPASAISWNDSGPGTSNGSNGGGGQTGISGHCGSWLNANGGSGYNPGALYTFIGGSWQRFWEYGYSSCVAPYSPASNWDNDGAIELCPTGYLVYRFYGTANDPAKAVTRSRLNLTDWCATESSYSFPGTNAMDSGTAPTLPWAQGAGTNGQQAANWLDSAVYRNDAGVLVPGIPTQVTGSCTAQQSSSSMRAWFDSTSPEEQLALRAALGTDYWITSSQGQYPQTGASEAGITGTIRGYTFDWDTWKKDTTKVPTYVPNGDGYYLTAFDWENRGCASPFQFVNDTSTAADDRTVVGTCYIPLMRERRGLVNVRTGAKMWKWTTLQHDFTRVGYGGGERLSLYYRNAEYTPNGPGGDALDAAVTGLSAASQTRLISGWRDAMVADYLNWWNSGLVTGSGSQVVPANAYASEYSSANIGKMTATDGNQAVAELWNNARCRVATSITFEKPDPIDTPDPRGTVNLTVNDQEVYQVSATEATVKVTAGALRCEAGACPAGAAIKTLSWDTKLSTTGGYKLCKVASKSSAIPVNCDGVYWGGAKVTSGGKQTSQTLSVRFVHPTSAKQVVRATVNNLKGTYTQVVETTGMQIHGVSPATHATYTIDTGPLYPTVTRNLKITATGTPVALTAISGGYRVDTSVIGAVQIPTLD